MGCTESVPVATEFHQPFKVDNPPLGQATSTQEQTQLVVRQKLFSWSGGDFRIKTLQGIPYQSGVYVRGKVWAFRDQMTLKDAHGEPLAVCLRKFEFIGQTFKIYTLKPLYSGQPKSERQYNDGRPLYTYCKIERVPMTTEQSVTMANEKFPSISVHRAGSWFPKKRVVRKNGRTAALMEGGTWGGPWDSYLLTVNPGIDPLLIVCLAAICDEMDETDRDR